MSAVRPLFFSFFPAARTNSIFALLRWFFPAPIVFRFAVFFEPEFGPIRAMVFLSRPLFSAARSLGLFSCAEFPKFFLVFPLPSPPGLTWSFRPPRSCLIPGRVFLVFRPRELCIFHGLFGPLGIRDFGSWAPLFFAVFHGFLSWSFERLGFPVRQPEKLPSFWGCFPDFGRFRGLGPRVLSWCFWPVRRAPGSVNCCQLFGELLPRFSRILPSFGLIASAR